MFILVHPLGYGGAFIQFGADGHDESVPYAYGMYAADYPRTPTFTPRAPTVGSRFIVPAYHGIHAVGISVFHLFCFSFVP